MEINENNENLRMKYAIKKQKVDLLSTFNNAVKSPETSVVFDKLSKQAQEELKDADDALCRTEIVTKFDLMDID